MKPYIFIVLIASLLISGCGSQPESSDGVMEDKEEVIEDSGEEEITEDIDTSELDELEKDFANIEEFL